MIVDDMPIFLEYLRGCIDWNAYGFEICCEAHDGREALQKMEEYLPDVVLTDITMPYLNGLELSEKIIKDYPDTAVVLITGNNEFEYARKAVKIGVCDYIVKPFEVLELMVRIEKVLARTGALNTTENICGLEVDFDAMQVKRDGEEIHLKTMEFKLFEVLIRNKNKAISREKLLSMVWGVDFVGETRTVDVHIGQLRKKLGLEDAIKTIPQFGYRLEVE